MVYFSFGHSTLVACHFARVRVQELLLQYVDTRFYVNGLWSMQMNRMPGRYSAQYAQCRRAEYINHVGGGEVGDAINQTLNIFTVTTKRKE